MEEVNEIQRQGSANISNTLNIQIAPFGTDAVYEFIDKYEDQKWALKTLSEVVAEIDFGKYTESCGLRLGLSQLIEMCIIKQKKIIDELEERVKNSPEDILREAKAVSGLMDRGCSCQVWYSRGLAAIKRLEALISLSDVQACPEASLLKNRLLSKINHEKDSKSRNILTGTDGERR